MKGAARERYKRFFDLCAVGAAAVLLLPLWMVLCISIPLAIRLESRGPALYRQARLGRGGRVFLMFKFRTMVDRAKRRTGPVWAGWSDARVTRVGRFLRRCHLDEPRNCSPGGSSGVDGYEHQQLIAAAAHERGRGLPHAMFPRAAGPERCIHGAAFAGPGSENGVPGARDRGLEGAVGPSVIRPSVQVARA